MTKLSRREAMARVGLLMGGVLSAPAISLLSGCQPQKKEETLTEGQVFKSDQVKLISTICGVIIPATSTPGAIEAGVPEFVTRSITDCYPQEDIDRFKTGLAGIGEAAEKSFNNNFVALEEKDQLALLTRLEKEGRDASEKQPAHFSLHMLKELTLVGYFTSEIGATQALSYVHVPGAYDGCVDLEPNQKSWAT